MSVIREVGKIQIDEDLPFLRNEWRIQRIGWFVIGFILLLALLGVFGHGPVAHDEAGDARTFSVSFDRIIRHGAITDLIVHVGPGLQRDSTVRVLVARAYLDAFIIEDITPQPIASGLSDQFVYFDFARPDARAPARIHLRVSPHGYWNQHGTIGLAGVTTVEFSQFILP